VNRVEWPRAVAHGCRMVDVAERDAAMNWRFSTLYKRDGQSYKGFIAGPSLPYCAHFSMALRCAGREGRNRR
jgi:hypothetical protein